MSLAPAERTTTLLAVCDVLTLKALDTLGRYIARGGRDRAIVLMRERVPYTVAHTLWRPDDVMVDKALRGAWDVVPPVVSLHGCCDVTADGVVCMLDEYVHDLAVTGYRHDVWGEGGLAYRFESRLGLPTLEAAWT